MNRLLVLGLLLLAAPPLLAADPAPPIPPRVLTLDEALGLARRHQPALQVAQARTAVAEAQKDARRAPLLPQVEGAASYARQTANTGASTVNGQRIPARSSFDTENRFAFGVTASQLVWDFGRSWNRYAAADLAVEARREGQATALADTLFAVRRAYFAAAQNRALLEVATGNLRNQERHLRQIEGFVQAGTRPEIDVAQVRADVARARLELVRGESAYLASKTELNRAMGVTGPADYEVAAAAMPPVDGEGDPEEKLIARALAARPDLKALGRELEATSAQIDGARGGYLPRLGVSTGVTDAGPAFDSLVWNWNVTATASWALFEGGATAAEVDELQAARRVQEAELEAERQRVGAAVRAARLELLGALAAVEAADLFRTSAAERLRLAEARYEAGVGSIIELQDAQLSVTGAEAQAVTARHEVDIARARLLQALGTP